MKYLKSTSDFFRHPVEWLDRKIRRFTNGPFDVRITIQRDTQAIENFPTYPDIPDFLQVEERNYGGYNRETNQKDIDIRKHYHYWQIKFQYFWTISNKDGNQYLARKLFDEIKKAPKEYWSIEKIFGGLKTNNNAQYVHQRGDWIILHVEPRPLYYVLDQYIKKEENHDFRKEWRGEIKISEMAALVEEFADIDFTNPDTISFFEN